MKPFWRALIPALFLLATPVAPAMAETDGGSRTGPSRPAAPPPRFLVPVVCTPGTDCWVMNYVDVGPERNGAATDPLCGPRSYEGNKGTVFALRDIAQMEAGVNVRAAQSGTVQRVRNQEPDRIPTDEELKTVAEQKRECGNAVLIDHGGGTQTVYCHLKQGSITVKAGDVVRAGDAIGQVGLSGYTRFPQLHFGVLWRGAVVDPFTGLQANDECGTVKQTLWDESTPLSYEAVEFYNAGFMDNVPALPDIDKGHITRTLLPADVSILSFWAGLFGAENGDEIVLTITAPDGNIFSERSVTQTGTPTRQMYYTGRQMDGSALTPGNYKGTAVLSRVMKDGSKKEWSIERSVTIGG